MLWSPVLLPLRGGEASVESSRNLRRGHECGQWQSGVQDGPLFTFPRDTWRLVALDMDSHHLETFTHRPVRAATAQLSPDFVMVSSPPIIGLALCTLHDQKYWPTHPNDQS